MQRITISFTYKITITNGNHENIKILKYIEHIILITMISPSLKNFQMVSLTTKHISRGLTKSFLEIKFLEFI